MTPSSSPDSSRQGFLEEVLEDFMQRLDLGEAVNREQLVAQHPEMADELRSYFAGIDEVERLGRHTKGEKQQPALPGRPPPGAGQAEETLPGHGLAGRVGDYELLEQIGQGGMGVIYKARQLSLQRFVALKMIRPDRLASPVDVLRFRSEAEAVASLDHPHIVPIYEVGEYGGQHYFSMKLIVGGSLAKHLPRLLGDLPAGVGLLAAVARAVHYAHQRGLLHRDLKPANILLDAEGRPHVTDFGLVKRLGPRTAESSLTQQGMIVGTPNYMAPEQAASQAGVSTAADVYSLGAILYELLTGRPPFRSETALDTLRQLLEREPVRPHSLNRLVDRDLETVCLKCLHKDPPRRYPSAEALADDLERWRKGEPIHARPVSRRERVLKWVRRRPGLAVLAALLVLVTLAGFFGVSWQWQRAEGEFQKAADLAEARGRTEYARSISLAYAEWRAGNAGRAEQMLAECRPELCGWEWHYLRRLFRVRQLATRDGHTKGVLAVAFSPDGAHVASAGADGIVKVWRRRDLREDLTLRGHTAAVKAVVFSPDGRCLASGGGDGTVRIWDAAQGKELARWPGHAAGVTGLAFDPRGRYLASTGGEPEGGEVKLWNATTGKALAGKTWHRLLAAVAFSPDGKYLATAGHDENPALWDAVTLEPVGIFQGQHQRIVSWTSVAFSADGMWVAAGSPDGLVRVWDRATAREFFSALTPTQAGVHGLAFCGRDSRILAAATADNTVLGWYTKSAMPAFTLRGHRRVVTAVACSPDGRRLVSGSLDQTVKLWDLTRRDDDLTLIPANQGVTGVAFSPNGRHLAAATRDKAVKVWDLASREIVFKVVRLPAPVNSLAFHPDGGQLASAGGDGSVRLWEVPSGREKRCLRGHRGPVQAVTFRPDGRRLASAGQDGVTRVWDAATGREVLALDGHGGPVHALAFGPDGRHLATAGEDGVTRVWEGATGREVLALAGHGRPVHAVAFSPDARQLATAGQDEAIRVWDAATGELTQTMRGHAGAVRGLAYNPKGQLASVGDDKAVRLWDRVGQELLALRGHTEPIRTVAFSPDGHRLASASDDGTIKVWDGTPLEGASAGGK
jgi:WD40 repeat protein/tRNA A-37 threonylcarbamoyl transferase component Bud32